MRLGVSRRTVLRLGAVGIAAVAAGCSSSDGEAARPVAESTTASTVDSTASVTTRPGGPSDPESTAEESDDGESATEFDVVVIGAGIAGLAAARELADAGLAVIVLEASAPSAAGFAPIGARASPSTSARAGSTAPRETRSPSWRRTGRCTDGRSRFRRRLDLRPGGVARSFDEFEAAEAAYDSLARGGDRSRRRRGLVR